MAPRAKSKPPRRRKRTGRRPGGQSSRPAVLDAARGRFARDGYDATTIRAVAADAGVDPSLVMQFYGSKDGLFRAVLELLSAISEKVFASVRGPRAGLGARLTRAYLLMWEDPVTGDTLRTLVRAAIGSRRATILFQTYLAGRLNRSEIPEGKRLGFTLAASHLFGTAVGRYIVGVPPLVAVPLEELVQHLTPAIDRYLETFE